MKVSNFELMSNRTLRFRRMDQKAEAARLALEYAKTEEAVVITKGSVKFNPVPIVLRNWQELLALDPPYEQSPKPVSPYYWMFGDNPFLIMTVGGGLFPIPDHPDHGYSYQGCVDLYTAAEQAAIRTATAKAQTKSWGVSTFVQLVFAGIAALMAVVIAAALLPGILEKYG